MGFLVGFIVFFSGLFKKNECFFLVELSPIT